MKPAASSRRPSGWYRLHFAFVLHTFTATSLLFPRRRVAQRFSAHDNEHKLAVNDCEQVHLVRVERTERDWEPLHNSPKRRVQMLGMNWDE